MATKTAVSIEVEITEISVSKALDWLERYSYERQRPLSDSTVKMYAQAIKDGDFTAGSQMHIAYTPDGKGYLINGQHRLWAVIESAKALYVSLLETQVNSIEEVDQLYYREDANHKRNLTDAIRATNLSKTSGMSAEYLRHVSGAAKLIEFGNFSDTSKKLSPDVYLEIISRWFEPAKVYQELLSLTDSSSRSRFLRSAIFSIALVTLRDAGTKAHDFWLGIFADDGLKKGDPRKAVIDFIWKNGKSQQRKGRLTSAFVCRGLMNAWNAWYENRELTVINVPQASLQQPLNLLGTKCKRKREEAKLLKRKAK